MKIFLSIFFATLLAACAVSDEAPVKPTEINPAEAIYIVKDNDTLPIIAKKLAVDLPALAAVNNLESPYELHQGQELKLPSSPVPPSAVKSAPSPPVKIVVKPKELPKKLTPQKFIWPLKGKVTAKFGPLNGGMFNNGINIVGTEGQEVKAIADGEIIYIGTNIKGYGNLLVLKHYGGWFSAYSCKKIAAVKKGEIVGQGQIISYIGATEERKVPQLHLVLRKKKKLVDPLVYLH